MIVSSRAALTGMFDEIAARWGGVDIVVNNAAITRDAPVMMRVEAWDEVVSGTPYASSLAPRRRV
jgi:NAD(P)-dependent dehydrogenase (short-subunit alcohol dehydrogenase family)